MSSFSLEMFPEDFILKEKPGWGALKVVGTTHPQLFGYKRCQPTTLWLNFIPSPYSHGSCHLDSAQNTSVFPALFTLSIGLVLSALPLPKKLSIFLSAGGILLEWTWSATLTQKFYWMILICTFSFTFRLGNAFFWYMVFLLLYVLSRNKTKCVFQLHGVFSM